MDDRIEFLRQGISDLAKLLIEIVQITDDELSLIEKRLDELENTVYGDGVTDD